MGTVLDPYYVSCSTIDIASMICVQVFLSLLFTRQGSNELAGPYAVQLERGASVRHDQVDNTCSKFLGTVLKEGCAKDPRWQLSVHQLLEHDCCYSSILRMSTLRDRYQSLRNTLPFAFGGAFPKPFPSISLYVRRSTFFQGGFGQTLKRVAPHIHEIMLRHT